VYARQVGDRTLTLGVSGKLWRDAMVLYDRETDSLWSQVNGEAIQGDLSGEALPEIPSEVTTWADWKARHPDTLVLKKEKVYEGSHYVRYAVDHENLGIFGSENPDERLGGKVPVYGLRLPGGGAVAVVETRLDPKVGLAFNAKSGSYLLAPAATSGMTAYALPPSAADPPARRDETGRWTLGDGSVLDPEKGAILSGPQAGESLTRIRVLRAYWYTWASFYPNSEIVD